MRGVVRAGVLGHAHVPVHVEAGVARQAGWAVGVGPGVQSHLDGRLRDAVVIFVAGPEESRRVHAQLIVGAVLGQGVFVEEQRVEDARVAVVSEAPELHALLDVRAVHTGRVEVGVVGVQNRRQGLNPVV